VFKFQATPTDVTRRCGDEINRRIHRNDLSGLINTLPGDKHTACHDEGLCRLPTRGEPPCDEQEIESLCCSSGLAHRQG